MQAPRILDLFNALAEADPGAVALYDAHAGKEDAFVVTRAELRALATSMAADLHRLGVGRGDCVGVWLPNWSTAVAAQLAALSLGAHVIGINTRYNIDEVAHVLDMAHPRAILIAHDFNKLDLLGTLRSALKLCETDAPTMLVVAAPGEPQVENVDPYDLGCGAESFRGQVADPSVGLAPCPEPALATAFTTSGSTGRSKLAAHAELGVAAHSVAVAERMQLSADDVVLGALPLSGVFGYTPAMAALVTGAAILLEPVFEARGVLLDMATYHVTHAAGADDLLGRLATQWTTHREPVPLRWIGIADFEGKSRAVAEWAESELGAVVAGVYGSSELFALTSVWPADYPPEQRWSGGGRMVSPLIQVRVVDPVDDTRVADGAEGELQFRGPNVVDAYLGDQSLSEGAFTADGWFRTGDLGRKVAPDTIEYLCRMGDVLRLRGFLVDPSEIEVRLAAHPAVTVAKVVGVRGPDGGTQAVGFVTVEGDVPPSAEELRHWCTQTLAKFKVPTHVYVIEEMPTTSGVNGSKIRASELRTLAAARVGAEP